MSQWARENPERYEEIAALPLNQQNAALRDAIGYDPDAIRDYAEDRVHHHHRQLSKASPEPAVALPPPSRVAGSGGGPCGCCGAPKDAPCADYCVREQRG